MVREAHRGLVRQLRPDAVPLTDAFAYPDYMLNSALGRKDGDVYKARWARCCCCRWGRGQGGVHVQCAA